jgi:hypothetical protein
MASALAEQGSSSLMLGANDCMSPAAEVSSRQTKSGDRPRLAQFSILER